MSLASELDWLDGAGGAGEGAEPRPTLQTEIQQSNVDLWCFL